MTSNVVQYEKAFDDLNNPEGKKNLFPIGIVEGLHKPSVLFLNDAKYINTARIIDVKARINPHSKLFDDIKNQLQAIMFQI